MALQQPRPEIFARMDRVVLMLNGGHIVYDGPPSEVAGYLQSKVSKIVVMFTVMRVELSVISNLFIFDRL
jgi:hypothetical protein